MSENAARFGKVGSGSWVQPGRVHAAGLQRVGGPRRLSGIQLFALVIPLALVAEGIARIVSQLYD